MSLSKPWWHIGFKRNWIFFKIHVHRGFNKQFRSAWDEIKTEIQLKCDSDDLFEEVLVTGHSLGGSLATLCAKETAEFTKELNKKINVEVITFGAPRVGDSSFATCINRCQENKQIQRFQRLCLGIVSFFRYCPIFCKNQLETWLLSS